MTAPTPKPNLKERLALIGRLAGKGDLAGAEPLARQLQAAYPRRPEPAHALGLVLLQRGRPELAEPFLKQAAQAEKVHAGYRLDLGECLLMMGRVTEAAAEYDRALALQPASQRVNWKVGNFLLGTGRGGEALTLLRAALDKAALDKAAPGEAARIHLDLVECLLSLGRAEEAGHEIRSRINATPFRARYVVLLSQTGKDDASSPVFALIEAELARPGLPGPARSDLLLRKGSLLDRSGRYEEAFRCWTEAKRLLGERPVAPQLGRMADERIAAFPAERLRELAEAHGTLDSRPIFVIGLPRSGTTLVSEILAAHDAVGNAGEIETMTYIAARMRGAAPLASLDRSLAEMGSGEVRALAELYRGVTRHLVPDKPRAVDKMPNNFLYVGEAAILFPQARFILCNRHPGDIFISAVQTEMNAAHAYTYDPEDFAAYHRHFRRLMRHWQEVLPGRILSLDYEALVTRPREVVGELLAFLGLPWQEDCLSPGANASTVRTFSRLQVRAAIHPGSVGRWRNYEAWIAPVLAGAG